MIRVGIIEDSKAVQLLMKKILGASTKVEIAWSAMNTIEARRLLEQNKPDVLTLDINLPGENGLDFLAANKGKSLPPTITVSSLTATGTAVAIEALKRGAIDTIVKPQSKEDVRRFARELSAKVIGCGSSKAVVNTRKFTRRDHERQKALKRIDVIGIVSSTGGWRSINDLLVGLTEKAPPVLIVQHIEPAFAPKFCERINQAHPFDVAIAKPSELLKRGMVRLAPPGFHISAKRQGLNKVVELIPSTERDMIVPCGDILLSNLADRFGSNLIGAVLTGMGTDGAKGLHKIFKANGTCFGEAEASCTIYGMPREAKKINPQLTEMTAVEIGNEISKILGYHRAGH